MEKAQVRFGLGTDICIYVYIWVLTSEVFSGRSRSSSSSSWLVVEVVVVVTVFLGGIVENFVLLRLEKSLEDFFEFFRNFFVFIK